MEYEDLDLDISKEEWNDMEPSERFVCAYADNGGYAAYSQIDNEIDFIENYAGEFGKSDEEKERMLRNLELAKVIVQFPDTDVKAWLDDKQENFML